jgi:hypothetical protein
MFFKKKGMYDCDNKRDVSFSQSHWRDERWINLIFYLWSMLPMCNVCVISKDVRGNALFGKSKQ